MLVSGCAPPVLTTALTRICGSNDKRLGKISFRVYYYQVRLSAQLPEKVTPSKGCAIVTWSVRETKSTTVCFVSSGRMNQHQRTSCSQRAPRRCNVALHMFVVHSASFIHPDAPLRCLCGTTRVPRQRFTSTCTPVSCAFVQSSSAR